MSDTLSMPPRAQPFGTKGRRFGRSEERRASVSRTNHPLEETQYMNDEVKKILNDLNVSFEAFKKANVIEKTGLLNQVTELREQVRELETVGARTITAGSERGRPEALKAFQDFLRSGNGEAMKEFARPQAAASTLVGPNTAYLVTQEVADGIEKLQRDFSPLRRLARGYQAKTDLVEFLVKDRSATSGWVSEVQGRPETQGDQLDKVAIPLGEVYAYIAMTQRMLDDSPDLAAEFVTTTIADQFNQQEGVAFITGNGINKPRGILTYPTSQNPDATRPFGTMQFRKTGANGAFVAAPNGGDCLVNLVADLRGPYRQGSNVAWLMNSATQAQVRLLKDSQGRPLFVPGLTEGEPDRLLGFEVAIDENMPAIAANSYSIAFANWSRALVIADHVVGTRIIRDPFSNKPNVMFYATRRVSSAVLNSESIKLLQFAA